MIREPKLPHKLKWGDRAAARAGACHKYMKPKDIVHEES